jgi:hypothetical protein
MTARHRLLFSTSALLYLAPFYGGLGGLGLWSVAVFAGLLMAWLAQVRPGDWPHRRSEWRSARTWAWLALIFAVQAAVAAFCLAVGNALGGLYAVVAPAAVLGAPALGLAGVIAARVLRRRLGPAPVLRLPGVGLGIGAGILDAARPDFPGRPDPQRFVDDLAATLARYGRAPAPPADLDRIEASVAASGLAGETFAALEAERRLPPAFRQLATRLALHPAVRPAIDPARLSRALDRALVGGGDGAAVAEAARLVRLRLDEEPGLAAALPAPSRLRETSLGQPAAAAQALAALADALAPTRGAPEHSARAFARSAGVR